MEVGPWRMDGKGGFKVTEGGWEEYTTMVYVDQPAGTGFSYTSSNHYVHTLQEGSEQWIEFLRNFYKVFPEYKRMDTYLGGESFAGQYIPYYAEALMNSDLGVPLKGAAIGNGWIDARRQYPSFLEFSVKVGILEENSDLYKDAKQRTDACMVKVDAITDREPINVPECETKLIPYIFRVENKEMCINIYDVRLDDTAPACGMNWPPDIKPITTYLDRPDVVRALHAEAHSESWIECRGRIHKELHETQSNSSISVLPKVLEKIPVLIFAGDQDLICNYIGMEAMINALTWNGATGLGTVQTQSWNVDGVPAGTWVSSRNLTYTKIFNASHMAPFDVPHITHDMILRFMGVDFASIVEGSAKIPSSVGSETKPMYVKADAATATSVPTGKTPQQDKAMWEAYYNAGSTALVLLLIVIFIGLFIWWRKRQGRAQTVRLPLNQSEAEVEESIPLTRREENDSVQEFRTRKGKERAVDPSSALSSPSQPIFDVGSDEEDDEKYRDK
ncbi:Alpha/Beta hydrolase protein [Lentinula raphanica]|nr:Alpha/Beta hydrolase protein [Lentinula raphanica]